MGSITTADALTDVQRDAWARLTLLMGVVPAQLDEHLRAEAGVNQFQFSVLEHLAATEGGAALMSDVARSSDSSLSRLSHTVTRLETLGLVERRSCDTDRRATWAALTDDGHALVVRTQPAYHALVRSLVLDKLDDSQLRQLSAIVGAVLPDSGACAS